MNDASSADRLLAFVRGDLEIADLEDIGVTADFSPGHVRVQEAGELAIVMPSPHDVTVGVLKTHSQPASARRWAAGVLAINAIDLALLEGDDEQLLEVLWDISAGEELSEDRLAAVRALANL